MRLVRVLFGWMLKTLIKLTSKFYTYELNQSLNGYRNLIYTLWLRNFIGVVGKNTYFCQPIILQGGGHRKIKIGSSTTIGHHTVLGCWERYGESKCYEPEIIIGDNCKIGEYCHISAIKKVSIDSGLLTGRYVYIGDNSHGSLSMEEAEVLPAQRNLILKGEVKIGRNVWIGDKVSILGCVSIGDNVIIGAGSIVTHDIPSNSLAAGVPAKILKQL